MELIFSSIHNKEINFIQCTLYLESGCNALEGEYSIMMNGFIGGLDIDNYNGTDDISLINECIRNDFDFEKMKEEVQYVLILKESGEWEDVFWHKYYEIAIINEI